MGVVRKTAAKANQLKHLHTTEEWTRQAALRRSMRCSFCLFPFFVTFVWQGVAFSPRCFRPVSCRASPRDRPGPAQLASPGRSVGRPASKQASERGRPANLCIFSILFVDGGAVAALLLLLLVLLPLGSNILPNNISVAYTLPREK